MERLKLEYKLFIKALTRLEHIKLKFEAISNDSNCDEEDLMIFRDSLIQRFEFCYDLLWKLLKSYLEEKFQVNVASPKKIFYASLDNNIISREELDDLLNMSDDRNYTSHTYNETLAEEIGLRIILYITTMGKIIKQLKI